MKQGFRIVTCVYVNSDIAPRFVGGVQTINLTEVTSGTYTIFRDSLEDAITVLRRRTQDRIQSATRISEEILY